MRGYQRGEGAAEEEADNRGKRSHNFHFSSMALTGVLVWGCRHLGNPRILRSFLWKISIEAGGGEGLPFLEISAIPAGSVTVVEAF